jgi:alkanesulfonate monooxygenase SsuD/methylene tetrahydromethanopterin reductase-like flavin-dependent oxidoreductase (luciferase family)
MQGVPSASTGDRVTRRGLGMAVAAPPYVIRAAAMAAEDEGFHSFWLNNPPRFDALAVLASLAPVVPSIQLGVGVIPLAAHSPEDITRDVKQHNVPVDRFYLGIGSGSGTGGVERVREGIERIRLSLQCKLAVAALGPRMCRLAGERADVVLFNWLTPDWAQKSIGWVRDAAEEAGRPMPELIAYVRVALGAEACDRLRQEAANYTAIPHYSAHFARMGVPAEKTGIMGETRAEIEQQLATWDGVVDEVVVRAIAARDTEEDAVALVRSAAPRA